MGNSRRRIHIHLVITDDTKNSVKFGTNRHLEYSNLLVTLIVVLLKIKL